MSIRPSSLLLFLALLPSIATAQDLNGYQPPPMFGAAPAEQTPIAPLPEPVPEAAPATPPVYKAAPKPRSGGKMGLPADEPIVTHPLSDALKGIDSKAPPPPMPTIADKVVPRPDMRPMEPGDKVPPSEIAKPVAPAPVQEKTVAKAKPEPKPLAKVPVAKAPVAKAPVAKVAAAKPVKVVDPAAILIPKAKPKPPVKLAEKTPPPPKTEPKKPAVKAPDKKAVEAKPAAVKPAPAPSPAPPIVADLTPKPAAEKAPAKAETDKTYSPPPKKSNLPKPTVTTEKMPPIKVPQVEKQALATPQITPPEVSKPAAPAVAAPAAPAPPAEIASAKVTSRLVFAAGQSDLNLDNQAALQKDILAKLEAEPSARLQIVAFATAVDEGISSARRVSLSRALGVRDYLKELGVAPYRMDVRAMGNRTTQSPVDRVDLLLIPGR